MTDPAPTPEPDVYSLSSADATAKLNELAAAFRAPPTPPTATTPQEAIARLRQLTADPKWREHLLTTGNATVRREFNELTALAAAGDEQIAPEVEIVDAVSDPHAVSKANYAALIDAVREQGLPDKSEDYIKSIDSGERNDRPTTGDKYACEAALQRLLRDPAFRANVLRGDTAANNLMNTLVRVIAYAAEEDDQPVSANTVDALNRLGLR